MVLAIIIPTYNEALVKKNNRTLAKASIEQRL
jgi:hypothetical protein